MPPFSFLSPTSVVILFLPVGLFPHSFNWLGFWNWPITKLGLYSILRNSDSCHPQFLEYWLMARLMDNTFFCMFWGCRLFVLNPGPWPVRQVLPPWASSLRVDWQILSHWRVSTFGRKVKGHMALIKPSSNKTKSEKAFLSHINDPHTKQTTSGPLPLQNGPQQASQSNLHLPNFIVSHS